MRRSAAIPISMARKKKKEESNSLAVIDPGVTLNVRREARSVSSSGGSRGEAGGFPPIFLDQNEARRAEKIFWGLGLPLISEPG